MPQSRLSRPAPHAIELQPFPDPWEVARRFAHLPHLLFLDSSDVHPERGRYSYVMANPVAFHTSHKNGFTVATELLGEARSAEIPNLPPFQGGIAGLFGYGLQHEIERLPQTRWDDLPTPPLALGRYEWVIAFDHVQGIAWLVFSECVVSEVPNILALLQAPPKAIPATVISPNALGAQRFELRYHPGVWSNFSRIGYLKAVAKAVEYVHAGDVFQVNISQQLCTPLREHPLELYARLRSRNPAPFGCYLDAGQFQILSASPERFLRVTAGCHVSTKPIKGTRRRGATPQEDAALFGDLRESAKDRAENVMIVDLLRNDLGRVCQFGSVRVPKVCEVESYRFVHHLVSEVVGELRVDSTPLDLLRAAFPGGSVTGAPKVRAMEIIAELEPTARGPYCGSLGFVGFNGNMDTNILIRTFTAAHGWLQFPVGGGVVADSDPNLEYEETLTKAAGLLRALET